LVLLAVEVSVQQFARNHPSLDIYSAIRTANLENLPGGLHDTLSPGHGYMELDVPPRSTFDNELFHPNDLDFGRLDCPPS
jgi:hypothetical protein